MSFAVEIDFDQVNKFINGFNPAAWGDKKHKLLDNLGVLVVEQTKERIDTEKTAPDGTAWAENKRSNPILHDEGDLLETINHEVMIGSVDVGSERVYAAIHQFGGMVGRSHNSEIIARPYIGLSNDNESEIEDELNHWMSEVFNV